jgi:diguanylate cyclase (GGDEF)-like protein/PAS domain S-box-containing protein
MTLDPTTLAAAYVLLSTVLGILLLFTWTQNRKIEALAWWSASFCLIPLGIGLANLGHGAPNHLNLLVANTFVTIGYGALYVGCVRFNERRWRWPVIAIGPVIWGAVFPFIHDTLSARVVLLALVFAGYATCSAWELARHAPQRLTSQRAGVVLLTGLAVFNVSRAMLGLAIGAPFGMNPSVSRWSAEMALLLVVYAPVLAFVFLAMAKEHVELDRKRAEQALRDSEEHYRYRVELNPQIPWMADPQGNIIEVSPRWEEHIGMPVEEALGSGWIQRLHPDDVAPTLQQWAHSLATGQAFDIEYRLRLADESYSWVRARAAPRCGEDGHITCWYGAAEDIHDRKLAEEQLHWAAYHDEMTGLPNRRLFQECLQRALDESASSQEMVGLLVMDLDHFKTINDRFGHDAGDVLLKEFARRLRGIVRTTDTIARLGGDEFAIILTNIPGENYVAAMATTILDRMHDTLIYRNRTLDCRTSIGAAISAEGALESEELLKQADLALYHCKAVRRGSFSMFQPSMREEAQRTASALEVARRAVEFDWIIPFYQPKVMLTSGGLGGFEALLRWEPPRRGVQSPEPIAPAFEDTELGTAIGRRMRTCIFEDIRNWLDAGVEIGRVAINASAAEFRHDAYAEHVLEELRRMNLPTSCLEVEVTETVFMGRGAGTVERALRTLSAAGVTIALDDFGTGYASLSHLKQFPVDVLKIDRSFIGDMDVDVGNAAIVEAVLRLSQSLGIEVVAEGVETAKQASLLRELGCDLGQGYYFGRPMPANDALRFMMSSAPSASVMTKR